ncbi:hypothetical protein [Haloarchaeobius salinus]|uniref:hypothetical protein n=1 Tax=Haloarchaeobius salinus TaxID=1198298 RepID=UPI002109B8EB|nr:hypothetical protein [Haloarchaeobius salinus]
MCQESIFTTEPVDPVRRDSVFPSDPDATRPRPASGRDGGTDVNPVLDHSAPFERRFDAATTVLGLEPTTLDFCTPTVTRMRVESAAEDATGESDAVVDAARELLVDVAREPSDYPLQF